ncbi:MAG: class II fructose-1,6-bisphosphate aldolase [Bacilli bacterium]|nr:class II fructose-1,6-bisphosphate aldolase [Bacilli bacterium]MDD3305305.1 class II fructose-1,6-bisphosphate aldolase [Bacilli bacterium]MDD4053309.1 class II fructose-1,6-bisphosphate aldolase [Bacilli bacterium]MDD4411350.1 class II fructose-1,6-bisphosphate aldolase [Bacilli bacterium]
MLNNTSEILSNAKKNFYAVPQFNINNLEWTKYILEVCEECKSPLILGVSEGASKYMGGYKTVYNIVTGLLKDSNITIPVVLHLDHGSTIECCKKAIDAGFTSVMIDSSSYSLEKNIDMTKEVVAYAHQRNVTVEAEVGHIGGTEENINCEIAYAKLDDCIKFVKETNIDLFAPALGSVHGIYKGEPNIDLERMMLIKDAVEIPLVLHGGTGIPENIIVKSIASGICKININTELQIAWSNAVRKFLIDNPEVFDPRKIIGSGSEALKTAAREKIRIFNSGNRV